MTTDPAASRTIGDVVAAADTMGLALIAQGGASTTVTSPASLQVALSMTAEGADGQTLIELETLLGASGQERSHTFRALIATLDDLDGDPTVVSRDELPETPLIHRANGLVLDHGFTVNPTFADALAATHNASPTITDLSSEQGKAILDAWTNEHTGGLIPESAVTPSADLQLVLQDAIVMAAPWEDPFLAALTEPADFTLRSGRAVSVEMMRTEIGRPTMYAEACAWQVIRLPYRGGRLYADVLLPAAGADPTEMTPELLIELERAIGEADPQPVIIQMPIVDVKSKLDLVPFLAQQAPSSLSGGFAPMGDPTLFISQAQQQGVIKLHEQGTVAAALTEVFFTRSMPPPSVEFTADRPYLVRIADAQTGWPLFFAHIADPRPHE